MWFSRLSVTLVCSSSLYDVVCLSCFVQVFVRFRLQNQIRFSANPIIDFGVVLIADLETWYSGELNIVICVGFCTLSFNAINKDNVSMFADSSFLFLTNLHCIDVLYQFEWMNIIYFYKKKNDFYNLVINYCDTKIRRLWISVSRGATSCLPKSLVIVNQRPNSALPLGKTFLLIPLKTCFNFKIVVYKSTRS